jgi:hypothetical protein
MTGRSRKGVPRVASNQTVGAHQGIESSVPKGLIHQGTKKRAPAKTSRFFVERCLVTARTAIAVTTEGATSASAPVSWRTVLAGTGFVDGQVAALEVLALKSRDGCVAFLGIAHRDKAKSAGTAGFTVGDQGDLGRFAVLGEEIAQILKVLIDG